MASIIPVLDSSFHNIDVVLGELTYNLLYKFNDSDKAWYLTIRDSDKNALISGIKVMPNQNLTRVYDYLNILEDGDIWCLRSRSVREPVGRNNLGVGLPYQLVYLNNSESLSGGLNGIIQL